MEMEEIWKDIDGANGYEISTHGRIRSYWRRDFFGLDAKMRIFIDRNRAAIILKDHLSKDGYKRRVFIIQGKRYTKYIHRLVLETFIGPSNKGFEADHINRIRDDNRLENLRWCSKKDNILNSTGKATLSDLAKLAIREKFNIGWAKKKIAQYYSITPRTVRYWL